MIMMVPMQSRTSPKFCGIVPPIITPLIARDTLDVDGLERLLNHVIEGGVAGLFILGTTGEGPSLSYRLRREMIAKTCSIVQGRLPVLVGVTDTAFVETVELAKYAADCGADAAVLTTPYYFPAGQTELIAYIESITPLIPLPMMLYNMPGLTKIWFEIDTLKQLASIESIIGVKDSSGDMGYFAELCKLKTIRPDWTILLGPEAKLAEAHALGGDGGVSGGANIAPQLFVECQRALRAGDETIVAETQAKITTFQEMYEIGKYPSRYIKATKSALSILGICSDLPADPFHHFLPPERERVAEVLKKVGLL